MLRIIQLRWNPFGFGLAQFLDFALLLLQVSLVLNACLERNDVLAAQDFCFKYTFGNQLVRGESRAGARDLQQ